MSDLKVDAAVKAIRDVMFLKCRDLGPERYMQVLEEIGADVDGGIDALKEENPELFG